MTRKEACIRIGEIGMEVEHLEDSIAELDK